jgi:hypothetical protein
LNDNCFVILYAELQGEHGTEVQGQVAKILATLMVLVSMKTICQIRKRSELENMHEK